MALDSWHASLCLLSLLALAVVAPVAPASAQPARHPITPEDLWAMERVGDPKLSPDGRWVVFSVSRYSIDENQGDSDLWVVPADGSAPPRRLTWNKGADSSPVWSPDGRRIAFVSKRGDAPPQLYLLPFAQGGEAQPATKLPIGVQDPRWFPDGKRIAFLAGTWPDLNDDWDKVQKRADEQKNDKTQAKIGDSRLLRYWDTYRTDGKRNHVFAVDLESGKVQDLTPGLQREMDFFSPTESWDLAPDGKEIAYSVNSVDPPYQTVNFDLYLQPIAQPGAPPAEPRNITADHKPSDSRPRYTPDGRFIVFGRNRREDVDPDFARLARYDRKTGEIKEIVPDWDAFAEGGTFTPDGKTLVFHAQDHGRTHVWTLPVDGSTPQPHLLARGGVTGGVSVNGKTAVFTRHSLAGPAEIYAVPLAGGEPKALTSFNAQRLAALDLGTMSEVTFDGAGGDQVHMFVVYPPGFDKSRKWPLVQMIHGGPFGAFQDEFHYRWNAPLLASKGYVVALVNFHGSTSYGQAFAEAIVGNHAEKPFEDIMKATDWLIAQGYIDEKRMAAAGGSYGGYMVDWILGHTDRFAALISHAGVYDLMGQFASDDTWGRPGNYGAAPWTDPARVDLYSPSRAAKDFKTPTLILHGEKDYRVPVTQGINLFGVLQGKGVPARIVLFPDENHWVLKPQAAMLWWKEVFAWLEKYLGRGPAA
jgi:dipeptidyl aminopeptidase/acylaminoacyl peptidase